MINKKDVTIIIPTLNTDRNNYARNECLKSLEESGFPLENIIIVFNNIGGQQTIFHEGGVRWMTLTDQGQCKATNAAVATVDTEWVMVSNDDMIFPPDWFERLTDSFDKIPVPEVAQWCISPQLIEPTDGAPTFKKVFFGGIGGDWNKEGFMEYAKTHKGEGVRPGFNLPFLMLKETWDMVGGYDIAYDPWGASSDTDLQCKFELAGVKTYQNTNCPVYHFSQTSGTFHPSKHSFWAENYAYFEKKWGFERPGDPDVWFSKDLIKYEQLKYKPYWKGFYEKKTQAKG